MAIIRVISEKQMGQGIRAFRNNPYFGCAACSGVPADAKYLSKFTKLINTLLGTHHAGIGRCVPDREGLES